MNPLHLPASFSAPMLRAVTIAALMLATEGATATTVPPVDPATTEIQKRLSGTGATTKIAGEEVDLSLLRSFYQNRGWHPAWNDVADKIVAVLGTANQDGLPAEGLHLGELGQRRPNSGSIGVAEHDLLLTDALLRYASAMRGQRANPSEIEDDWLVSTPSFDAVAFLQSHLHDLPSALHTLQPPYAGYQLLRQKLGELKAIAAAGDWPKVPPGPSLKPGVDDERIPAVRRRLIATGEFSSSDATTTVYDDALLAAVQLFQRRHGLADDGALGRQTVNAMNVSAAQLARQVAVNMERWRWLPQHLEDNHIVVNVPGAWMEVVEGGSAVLTMRVVVGDPDHPTPAMHAEMTSLVLNPTWRVPASIATAEILPKLKRDPGYLIANDLELVSESFPPGSPESQGVGISWQDRSSIPWPIRQRAGSDNALGRIKFNIPNNDDIYLHDTPNHKAFSRALRALSHGCIRLEKPDQLALYVLKDKDWSQQKLDTEIDTGNTRTVSLSKRLPVWLLYWTTWVDSDGVLQVRDDLYGRDQRLGSSLAHPLRPASMASVATPVAQKEVRCDGCRVP
ncbi:L,D-transpeptidase family protein [Telmatospirillum sp.]|uniref:L,D-transpeptidase family protein n=1 Tax=Telmatospirillum sp. TaxID=2079197 RepID=UPI00283E4DC3|nr:L,D-transpeptidase family protein [Telmatospirillum sp.]MDR3440057.1 L,D-transpeptidase family protein [Telmatospirillum sp.]